MVMRGDMGAAAAQRQSQAVHLIGDMQQQGIDPPFQFSPLRPSQQFEIGVTRQHHVKGIQQRDQSINAL